MITITIKLKNKTIELTQEEFTELKAEMLRLSPESPIYVPYNPPWPQYQPAPYIPWEYPPIIYTGTTKEFQMGLPETVSS